MRIRSDGKQTRERIIATACEVFARRGFKEATHETIARKAGVNKALINHHFGDKKSLYRAVWQHLLEWASREHPVSGDLPDDATAAEKLEAHVRALLGRHFGKDDSWKLGRLRDMEKTNPTGLVDDIRKSHHGAHRKHMLGALGELLGKGTSRATLKFYESSVLALCRAGWSPPVGPVPDGPSRGPLGPARINALAWQITRFMVAGIEARVHEAAKAAKT